MRELIADLNPVLRGWGNYFRTGNAAKRFNQLDTDVWQRLRRLRLARKGRHLKPGEARRWTREYFWNLGLTDSEAPYAIRRPRNATAREATRKPCAGNPHARFERGS